MCTDRWADRLMTNRGSGCTLRFLAHSHQELAYAERLQLLGIQLCSPPVKKCMGTLCVFCFSAFTIYYYVENIYMLI